MYAFVFPGQGSQFIGMGKDFFDNFKVARDVFAEVDEALSQKLSRLIFEGSESELNLTENTQPALMAVSLAISRVLEEEGGFKLSQKARLVAGHSLGEYSAIAAVGGLTLSDTARLLRIRGVAMQKAVPIGVGGMVAILGMNVVHAQNLADYAAQDQVCAIANDNSPVQVVLSGHRQAIERAIDAAKDFGASRAVQLAVSAPFHCVLMKPAAVAMQDAFSHVVVQSLLVPLIANVTAEPVQDAESIKSLLVDQVTGRVRWRESVSRFANHGIKKVVEIGAGKVLSGLTKRIDPTLEAMTINTPQDIELFLKDL
jgi:[acyl-carrier-protein] S-malonyltransferase